MGFQLCEVMDESKVIVYQDKTLVVQPVRNGIAIAVEGNEFSIRGESLDRISAE